jgi:hypothetical protein
MSFLTNYMHANSWEMSVHYSDSSHQFKHWYTSATDKHVYTTHTPKL